MTKNPLTREHLQMLYHTNQERLQNQKNKQITELVEDVYISVVAAANAGLLPPTSYQHEISEKYSKEFLEENYPKVMEKLRDLFPGCKVSYKIFISSFIVVDWS